jgi:cytosine/adenosine deaminase-related metal-dependent hydrolase
MRLVVGKLFDSYALELLENRVITVSQASGLILDVQPVVEHDINYSHPDVLDMRHLTVLPGFVDTHVHRSYFSLLTLVLPVDFTPPPFKCSLSAPLLRNALGGPTHEREHG